MVDSARTTEQGWPGLVSTFAVNVLFAAGLFSHAFLYNFYLAELQLSARVMGDAAAALTLGGLLALLPAGLLVDRVGPRRAYLIAAMLLAAGLAAGALATAPWPIYAAALAAGAGTATWRVAMSPLLISVSPERLRARAFSWNVALLVGSGALWTAVAGAAPAWIEQLTGWSALVTNRAALLLGAAGSVIGAGLVAALRIAPPAGTAPASNRRAQVRVPVYFVSLAAAIAVWMSAGGLVIPFLNLFFNRQHAVPVAQVGVLFAIAQLIGAAVIFLNGELAARFGAVRLLAVWSLAFAPLLLGLQLADALLLAVIFYVAQSIVPPVTNALIDQLLMERAPPDRRGAVSSWRNAATEASGFGGASVGGRLIERGSFGLLLYVAAAVAALGATVLLAALRVLGRRSAIVQPQPATQHAVEPLAIDRR
ncbi:MAG TPA: MFS transporter [Longimicrobiales bacterium]|nr:MFS transporter [Longimicrobiales bacterium]